MSGSRSGLQASVERTAIRWGVGTQARLAALLGRALGGAGAADRGAPLPLVDVQRVARAVVVRPDEIGDVVLTSPFLREFRRLLPDAHITLVVKASVRSLVELCPYVDVVRTYPPQAPRRWLRPIVVPLRALRFALAALRPERPELVVLPRWGGDQCYATFLAHWSGARWRVGHSERVSSYTRTINRNFDRLLTHCLDDRGTRHEVERALDVVRALGGDVASTALELWVAPADVDAGRLALAPLGTPRDARPIVAIGVGAGDAKRRWPAARYAAVARALQERHGAVIAVVGGSSDRTAQQEVLAAVPGHAVGLAGVLTLRETAAVLGQCALYVGNDSGPMHLAAAAGVPVVEISCHPRGGHSEHDNAPERFAPWGVPSAVLRPARALAPCLGACMAKAAHCILEVQADAVVDAARPLIGAGTARRDAIVGEA